ncbi:MAG: protein-glutamate O-methyltransferase CheR [Candidatus Wallbacteria bacterium]|nr:protein-glutamate O-methyltransferase CheR [Candidatus Wallbacteria bacterium]
MSDSEFRLLREFIHQETGIHLPDTKRTLLSNRLRPRLKAYSMTNFRDYYVHVRALGDAGVAELADAVTTGTTEFWRFPLQMQFVSGEILPQMASRLRGRRSPDARLWSAGCSTGEEPYSLAMAVLDTVPQRLATRFRIDATDLSPRAIEKARAGRYKTSKLTGVPPPALDRYFVVEPDGSRAVSPLARALVSFRVENLQDAGRTAPASYDAILCRNVMIYFSETARRQSVTDLFGALRPGGWLMLGPSEMILEPPPGLRHVAPSVYQKTQP